MKKNRIYSEFAKNIGNSKIIRETNCSLWIHYLLHDFTMNFPLIHKYRFRQITLTSLSASRFDYEFSICFANSVRIHSRFRDQITLNSLSFTIDLLSISWFQFEFTILFPKSLSIHYFFYKINLDSLSASRFEFQFTILFPKSLWIYYFFREINMNSLSVSLNHL